MIPAITIRFYPRKELNDSFRQWRDIVPHIHREIDEGMAKVETKDCRAGCSHCCKLVVHALPHEIKEVVEYVRYSDQFDRVERSTILERLRYAVEKTDGLDPGQYRDADVACPFLGDNDMCRVYPVRPIACRAFGSNNVEVCKLVEPDDGRTTFKVMPNSIYRLMQTSGLFFTLFLKGCLGWWQGEGVESPIDTEELEGVLVVQRFLDHGGKFRVNGSGE